MRCRRYGLLQIVRFYSEYRCEIFDLMDGFGSGNVVLRFLAMMDCEIPIILCYQSYIR